MNYIFLMCSLMNDVLVKINDEKYHIVMWMKWNVTHTHIGLNGTVDGGGKEVVVINVSSIEMRCKTFFCAAYDV